MDLVTENNCRQFLGIMKLAKESGTVTINPSATRNVLSVELKTNDDTVTYTMTFDLVHVLSLASTLAADFEQTTKAMYTYTDVRDNNSLEAVKELVDELVTSIDHSSVKEHRTRDKAQAFFWLAMTGRTNLISDSTEAIEDVSEHGFGYQERLFDAAMRITSDGFTQAWSDFVYNIDAQKSGKAMNPLPLIVANWKRLSEHRVKWLRLVGDYLEVMVVTPSSCIFARLRVASAKIEKQ